MKKVRNEKQRSAGTSGANEAARSVPLERRSISFIYCVTRQISHRGIKKYRTIIFNYFYNNSEADSLLTVVASLKKDQLLLNYGFGTLLLQINL